jgi:hypothetical protein
MLVQAFEQGRVFCARGSRLVENHDVEACKLLLVLPERFADGSLDPVPAGCVPAVLPRYSEPEACNVLVICPAQYGKPFITAAGCFFEYASESRR